MTRRKRPDDQAPGERLVRAAEEVLRVNAENARREALRRERVKENLRAAAPIVADLVAAGFEIRELDDLVRGRLPDKRIIPLLLRCLTETSNLAVKETIVRALTDPLARPGAAPALIAEYRRVVGTAPAAWSLRWAIGNALSVVADESVFDDLAQIVLDSSHGDDRQMAVDALGRMRNPRAVDVLLEVLDDETVTGHALGALSKLKAVKAKSRIETYLTHANSWYRRLAKQALARIEKAELKESGQLGLGLE